MLGAYGYLRGAQLGRTSLRVKLPDRYHVILTLKGRVLAQNSVKMTGYHGYGQLLSSGAVLDGALARYLMLGIWHKR